MRCVCIRASVYHSVGRCVSVNYYSAKYVLGAVTLSRPGLASRRLWCREESAVRGLTSRLDNSMELPVMPRRLQGTGVLTHGWVRVAIPRGSSGRCSYER